MLNKHCPHCSQVISLTLLKEHQLHKRFLQRQAIPCPHCQQTLQLPAEAEKLISIGLLLSVILAPLLFFWLGDANLLVIASFITGLAVLIMGTLKNQAQIPPANDTPLQQDHKHEKSE